VRLNHVALSDRERSAAFYDPDPHRVELYAY
jgi:hypothetical protein